MTSWRPRVWQLTAAAGILVTALAVFGLYRLLGSDLSDGPTSVPSCSWPLHMRDHFTPVKAGLVRCYLQAEARHDVGGMEAVAEQPAKITGRQFADAADARAGTASVRLLDNPSDSAYYTVRITYANGVASSVSMVLANPQSWDSWRLQIGS